MCLRRCKFDEYFFSVECVSSQKLNSYFSGKDTYLVPTEVEDIGVKDLEHFLVDVAQDLVDLLVDDVQLKVG